MMIGEMDMSVCPNRRNVMVSSGIPDESLQDFAQIFLGDCNICFQSGKIFLVKPGGGRRDAGSHADAAMELTILFARGYT